MNGKSENLSTRYEQFRVRVEPYVKAYAYAFFALVWLCSVLVALVALVSIAYTLGTQTFTAIGLLGLVVCVIWGVVATFFVLLCLKRARQGYEQIKARRSERSGE